ncbi:uncharacterized protein LOC135163977 [Diachasmimorpha longicaudata]|uniref:uncharacterized protein LOC135163977 n=1 Tax=Diachasmimorpha longicaudata TaxID=58733 RepID=UPI0030B8B491
MKDYAERLPVVGLTLSWEREIKNLIPLRLRRKFPELYERYMNETKCLYQDVMHEMGMKCVVSIGFDWRDAEELPFKFDGRTPRRPRFIQNRISLATKYFSPQNLVKNIFEKSHTLLPHFICDFTSYRKNGFIEATK